MSSDLSPPLQEWDTNLYQSNHKFVWEYGSALLDVLDPQPGERILDLGCGTGELTKAIADKVGGSSSLSNVIGIDADASMIRQAQQQYAPSIPFYCMDARNFEFNDNNNNDYDNNDNDNDNDNDDNTKMDAIFSNACLHWIEKDAQKDVIECMWKELKHGGRLVLEFGGKGNVEQIVQATKQPCPWYFPSISEYTNLLEQQQQGHHHHGGFEVVHASLFDRPVTLEGGRDGLKNWLEMFGGAMFEGMGADEKSAVIANAEDILRDALFDGTQWTADYRRIRIVARKL